MWLLFKHKEETARCAEALNAFQCSHFSTRNFVGSNKMQFILLFASKMQYDNKHPAKKYHKTYRFVVQTVQYFNAMPPKHTYRAHEARMKEFLSQIPLPRHIIAWVIPFRFDFSLLHSITSIMTLFVRSYRVSYYDFHIFIVKKCITNEISHHPSNWHHGACNSP